jgi:hypothetical protein
MASRKSWHEKLENGRSPEVCVLEKPMLGIAAGAKLLVSTPIEMREYIRHIPMGKAVHISQIREDLARRHKADVTCPLTTGIYLRIVSEAALDELESGKAIGDITPFWRAIGPNDAVAKKIRCGPAFIEEQRRAEGIA